MEISILGPVRVIAKGRSVPVGTGKELMLLISLGVAAGQPLSAEVLADRLWDDSPLEWRHTLYTNVTRLRRRLEAAGLDRTIVVQCPGGYRLDVDPQAVDWCRVATLRARAGAALRSGAAGTAASVLDEALGLWRGEPLAGVTGRWAEHMRQTIEQTHQAVLDEWAQAAVEARPVGERVRVLGDAVDRYPLNEALAGQLMRALHDAGRGADALTLFQRLRQRLGEELGSDPHPQLQRLHEEILRGAPGEQSRARVEAESEQRGGLRTNLGRDLGDFCDRHAEIVAVRKVLTPPAGRSSTRVCAISGMPGVGKSSLAIHVAHQIAAAFPDGCLYVDLQGHHEHEPPLPVVEAVGELLQLLDVSALRIRDSEQQRVAVWRDHTASKRLLVILDDAASAEQVRALLPSGAECGAIVTSRQRLADLDGAFHLALDVPGATDAGAMFATLAKRPQDVDRGQVATIAKLCGYLPLAMRLMATRLHVHPSWRIADVIERIHDATDSVREFRVGKRRLEAVFDVSLRSLSREAREGFLRLGLHPAPMLDRDVAAAMIGCPPDDAEIVFEELLEASLLQEQEPGCYRMHALIMAYAHRTARRQLSTVEQRSVAVRMLEAYVRACDAADRTAYPHRLRLTREPPPGEDGAEASRHLGLDWLRSHTPTVLTIIRHAARTGHDYHAAHLTHLLAEHIYHREPWHLTVDVHRRALALWHRQGDTAGSAQAHFELSRALLRNGKTEQAEATITQAHALWEAHGSTLGRAWALDQLGLTHYVRGDYERATEHHQRALELFEQLAHQSGIALSLHRRAYCHRALGAYHAAIADLSDALRVQSHLGDATAQLDTNVELAGCYKFLGYHREATQLCQDALARVQATHDRRREGVVRANLGIIAAYKGQTHQALQHYQDALRIHREVHDRWTEVTTLCNLGRAYLDLEALDEALSYFDQGSRLCETYVDPSVSVQLLLGYGQAHLLLDDLDRAQNHFQQAHIAAERAGLRLERAEALVHLGRLLLRKGVDGPARVHLETAEEIFSDIEAPEANTIRFLIDSLSEIST